MRILKEIKKRTVKEKIEFIVIGGHALNILGYARQTGDLDLLVSKLDRKFWINFLNELNYTILQEHDVFIRSSPAQIAQWPIDLMFVNDVVFKQLINESIEGDFSTFKAKVPSMRHMVALKLHALKQRQEHREEKDLSDVRELLRLGNISDADLRFLCEKYDRMDLYECLKQKNEKSS